MMSIAAAAPSQAEAQPASTRDSISVDAYAAFDGFHGYGEWVEMSVLLENSGPDAHLSLETRVGKTRFSTEVELPRGAIKRVPLAFLPAGTGVDRVALEVMEGETPIATREVSLRELEAGDDLVAVVSDSAAVPGGLEGLGEPEGDAVVVSVRPRTLPERSLAMMAVDHMVLSGADMSRIGDAQRKALYQWVALGGQLIVSGGATASTNVAGLPEDLRPASVLGLRELSDFGAVASFAAGEKPEGSGLVAELDPVQDAKVLASADGTPLVVTRRVGDGTVTLLAFDPASPPLDRWYDQSLLWRALDRRADLGAGAQTPDAVIMSEVGRLLSPTRLPSIWTTVALLAAYILLVGPLNYVVLRRQRRLDLAWITIPLLTVAAGVGAYGVGYRIHGGGLEVKQVSVVRVVPDAGVAHVTTYVDLISPTATRYDVRLSDDALAYAPISFDPYGLVGSPQSAMIQSVQGQDHGVVDFGVKQWSRAGFAAQAVVSFPVGDSGSLVSSAKRVVGELRNPFGRTLEGAGLVALNGHQWLGTMPVGFSSEASMVVSIREDSFELDFPETDTDFDLEGREYYRLLARRGLAGAVLGLRESVATGAGIVPYGRYGDPFDTRIVVGSASPAIIFGFDDKAPIDVEVLDTGAVSDAYTMYHAAVPLESDGS